MQCQRQHRQQGTQGRRGTAATLPVFACVRRAKGRLNTAFHCAVLVARTAAIAAAAAAASGTAAATSDAVATGNAAAPDGLMLRYNGCRLPAPRDPMRG